MQSEALEGVMLSTLNPGLGKWLGKWMQVDLSCSQPGLHSEFLAIQITNENLSLIKYQIDNER